MQTRATERQRGAAGRQVLLAGFLGLTVLLGHLLLMASERHAMDMGMGRGHGGLTPPVAQALIAPAALLNMRDDAHTPQPLTRWEECLTPAAVLPVLLLLLLLALIGRWRRRNGSPLGATRPHVWSQGRFFLHPPPLEPGRRRALLQVFRN